MRVIALVIFLALALQAQEFAKPGLNAETTSVPAPLGRTCDPHCPPPPSCDATDWKARAEWLDQKVQATEAKLAALAQFYSFNEQLAALAAKEPPKPKPPAKEPPQ